jgi:hypothetical protein
MERSTVQSCPAAPVVPHMTGLSRLEQPLHRPSRGPDGRFDCEVMLEKI